MAGNAELEYCRVDVKTGDILEGPTTLPRNWGNVTGFNNLPLAELRRRGWFPVDIANVPRPYGLMFLPEKGVVLKVPRSGVVKGRKQYAEAVLRQLADGFAAKDFPSAVLGDTHYFSNSPTDQLHRLNCLHTGSGCVCTAINNMGQHIKVSVQHVDIERLIGDSVKAYELVRNQLHIGIAAVNKATDREIAVMIDSGFAEFFDG